MNKVTIHFIISLLCLSDFLVILNCAKVQGILHPANNAKNIIVILIDDLDIALGGMVSRFSFKLTATTYYYWVLCIILLQGYRVRRYYVVWPDCMSTNAIILESHASISHCISFYPLFVFQHFDFFCSLYSSVVYIDCHFQCGIGAHDHHPSTRRSARRHLHQCRKLKTHPSFPSIFSS